ncbi:MAG: oligosaccharide flippase family protein [Actinomycetota bacterium]|nr:oligosaccharide flippase family protein [Actinomycetota bacterium]
MAVADARDGLAGRDEGEGSDQLLDKAAARDVRTVTKGGAVQIAGQLSSRGLSSIFIFLAFRVLGSAGVGLYRSVIQVAHIAGQLGLLGFNYASMRWISRARARGEPGGVRGAARLGLSTVAVASTLVAVGLFFLAPSIADRFADPGVDPSEFEDLIRLSIGFVPLFALMQVLRYCTQAYKTMVPSVVAGNIVQPTVSFLLSVVALAIGLDVAGVVGSVVISMGAGAAAAALYFRRMLTDEERAAAPKKEFGPMLRFALPQAGSSLLGVQTLGLGIILLSAYNSNEETGFFVLALALQGGGTVFLSGIVNIWAPVVSDLYDRNAIDRLGALYQTITRWVGTFSFPVYAALILEPDLFAEVFGGAEGAGAVPVVAILAAGNIFYSGTGPTGYVISMSGRPGVNFINSLVAIGLYIAIGIPVAREHGAVGIAIVDSSVTALVNSARVIEARILVGVQPFGRTFYKPVLATMVGASSLLLWRLVPGDSIPLEIAGVAVASVVYLAALSLFGTDPEEQYVWREIRGRAARSLRRNR